MEIRQAIVRHTYDSPTCKSTDRIRAKGHRLGRTLEAAGEQASVRQGGARDGEGIRYCWPRAAPHPITEDHPGTSAVKASISAGGAIIWLPTKCPQRPRSVRHTPR